VHKDYDTGDMQRWVWRNACVCAFVEWYDDQNARMQRAQAI
jgi:erythromycin esterase-like protein